MRAADTNVLVRLLAQDDVDQLARARAVLEGGLWICHLVLAETAWVLARSYRLDREAIAKAVEMLLSTAQVVVQDREIVVAAVRTFRTEASVGFSDCLILETARRVGQLPLTTFDAHLGKLTGAEQL